ncbi:MAG TPA: hypothetical protein VGO00_29400, partial [Kofleriaceae bacterium]|nr:hypothetical protein [Kofleriaceae bacterium]
PEVIRYNQWCHVASGADEFVAAIDQALAEDSPDARANRSSAMQTETWTARVAAVAKTVDEVAARKPR